MHRQSALLVLGTHSRNCYWMITVGCGNDRLEFQLVPGRVTSGTDDTQDLCWDSLGCWTRLHPCVLHKICSNLWMPLLLAVVATAKF